MPRTKLSIPPMLEVLAVRERWSASLTTVNEVSLANSCDRSYFYSRFTMKPHCWRRWASRDVFAILASRIKIMRLTEMVSCAG